MIKFRLVENQINKLIDEAIVAAENDGQEICGLLVNNGYFIELIRVNNKIKKGGGFAFYVNEIRFLQKAINEMDHEIIGTFHSHPAYIAEPSDGDLENALDDSYMLIVDVMDKKVGFWYIKNLTKKKIKFELL